MKSMITLFVLFLSTTAFSQSLVRRTIECDSNNYQTATCLTGLYQTNQVYVGQQLSNSACIQGQSYQIYNDAITVSNGCRAQFIAEGWTYYIQPGDQVMNPSRQITIECDSNDYKTATCAIPFRYVEQVFVQQQLSHSACIQGQSFNVFNGYIQVSNGCRALFLVRGY